MLVCWIVDVPLFLKLVHFQCGVRSHQIWTRAVVGRHARTRGQELQPGDYFLWGTWTSRHRVLLLANNCYNLEDVQVLADASEQ